MGTLSLQVMHQVKGYTALDDFPETAPDHGERDVTDADTAKPSISPDKFYSRSGSEASDSLDTYDYSNVPLTE